jgi:hypothetical protein
LLVLGVNDPGQLRAVLRKHLIWKFLVVKMGQNGFFFRNLYEKLKKKMLWKKFFVGHMRVLYGSKVDPYEDRPFHQKWSKIVNFIGDRN